MFSLFWAIEWSKLTEGLQTAFESGVGEVLTIVGAILAAFVIYKAIKRFVKGA